MSYWHLLFFQVNHSFQIFDNSSTCSIRNVQLNFTLIPLFQHELTFCDLSPSRWHRLRRPRQQNEGKLLRWHQHMIVSVPFNTRSHQMVIGIICNFVNLIFIIRPNNYQYCFYENCWRKSATVSFCILALTGVCITP